MSQAPDSPNFLGFYSMGQGTDYAQQIRVYNSIDDHLISELSRIVCYNQTIYDDALVEGSEYFGLTLSVPEASFFTQVRPMYDQAAVLILDNDG